MSTSRYLDRIAVIVMVCAVILTSLFMNGEAFGIIPIIDQDVESYTGNEYFTARDLNGSWDTEGATYITLNGNDAVINGKGVYSYDGDVYISAAGKYVLSGSLEDGSIVVDAYDSSKVYLLFDGVTVNCSDDAGLKVEQADKVFITLAEGSENKITCGEAYSDAAVADNVTGAVHAHDDITINGSGSLEINAGYRHGIVAKDDFIVTDGKISITAAEDGINANDSIRITGDADITVTAEDDGLHCDGFFLMTGGKLDVEKCYEGIEALTIDLQGGDILLKPEDDGINANGGSDAFGFGGPGGFGGHGMPGVEQAEGETADTMAGVQNGNRSDDMSGEGAGTVSADFAGDFPGRPDMALSGEETSAKEDTGDSETAEDSEDEETWVHISGGSLTIINETGQDADGIDSNGDIIISGGTVRVSLVNNGNNCALDYASESGGVAEISGGTVIACGNSSMTEQFDESSTQASILYISSEEVLSGTTVALKDAGGNVLLTYEVPQTFTAMNMSCPEMKVGETYTLVIGDKEEEIELEEISTSCGEAAGSGFGGGMGRGGGFGGHRGGGRFSLSGNEAGEFMGPPDFDISGNGMPDFNGGGMRSSDMSISGNGMGGPGQGGFPGEPGADTEESTITIPGKALAEFESDTWVWLILSVITIIAASLAALCYRRRR